MKWKSGEKLSRCWLILILIAAAAFGLRLWHLADRPVHTDEAVHAVILGQMLETGKYVYNPTDSHGPTLYFLSYPVLRGLGVENLAQMEAWQLRLVPVGIGALTILSLGFWMGELGAGAMLLAGAFIALAAPLVYYQRYYIHEGLFALLSLTLILVAWKFITSRGAWPCAVGLGLLAGLTIATKETASLVALALLGAGVATAWTEPRMGRQLATFSSRSWLSGGMIAVLVLLLTALLFYSSFGLNPRGPGDAFAAVVRFAHRAGGEGHEKPWWTCFAWLFTPHDGVAPWSGWIIFPLALAAPLLRWSRPLIRLLAFYTLATFLLYSAIPYKTPWLEVNSLLPACVLAGVGGWDLGHGWPRQWLALVVALGLLALGSEAYRLCFVDPIGEKNPLAYSPTVPDIVALQAKVESLAASKPPLVQVVSEDYWPLPWYLRHIGKVGYWSRLPDELNGDIVITSPALADAVQTRLGPGWRIDYFGLRPEVLAVVLTREHQP